MRIRSKIRICKIGPGKAAVNLAHDLAPDTGGRVPVRVDALGNVKACPHDGDIVGGDARKPAVLVFTGSAGLACNGHIAETCLGSCAFIDSVFHHPGQTVGCIRIKSGDCLGDIVQNNVPPAVRDHGIGTAVSEDPVIYQRAVSLGHFPYRNAIRQLAERHRRVRGIIRNETRKAEALGQIVVRGLGTVRKLVDDLSGNRVERPFQRLINRKHTVVFIVVVMRIPAGPGEHNVCRIVDQRVRRDQTLVECGTVTGKRFDGGAGRAGRPAVVDTARTDGNRAVQTEIDGLFPNPAAESQNSAVIGIHNDDGALKLLLIASALGHLFGIGILRVNDLLDSRVHAAVDLVAAVIEKLFRGVVVQTLLPHQIPDDIPNDNFFIIGIDFLMILLVRGALENQLLCHGAFPGVVIDIALFVHLAQDDLLPLLVVRLVVERVVIGRLVRDADDGGAFCQGKVLDVFSEIGMSCDADTPAAFTKIDSVEVPFENFLFVVFLFQFQSAEDLGQLALDGNLILAGQVFQKLLGDGRAAVACLHAGKHLDKGAGRAVPVNPLVVIETLVFDGNQSLLHILGDVFILDPDAPLIAPDGNTLLPLPGKVLIPDGAGFAQLIVFQSDIQIRSQTCLDIIGKNTGKQNAGNQHNKKDGPNKAENDTDQRRSGVGGKTGDLQNAAQRAADTHRCIRYSFFLSHGNPPFVS